VTARKRPPASVPTEHQEQCVVIRWADLHPDPRLKLLYAIPNGARTSIGTARKLKAEGLRAGVPDLCLPVPVGNYHGLYIELKRQKGGVVSQEQRDWHWALEDLGHRVVVCRGAEPAISVLSEYLNLRQP